MPSTVKMVAIVDGQETVVGRCHPGQARLLRKQGLARWERDKVVLEQAPPTSMGEATVSISVPVERVGVVRETVNEVLQEQWPPEGFVLPDGWEVHKIGKARALRCPVQGQASEHIQEMLAEDLKEIDPEGFVGNLLGDKEYPPVRQCQTGEEYLREIVSRRDEGHELDCADDPRSRVIGFIDVTDNLIIEVPLYCLKEAGEKVLSHFATRESRLKMLGIEDEEPPSDLTEKDLESIWESAPVSKLNAFVGQPVHNPETGQVEIPVNGIDSNRVAEIAGRAIVGRPPRPVLAHLNPGWSAFSWPRDHKAIVVYNLDHTPHPNPKEDDNPAYGVGSYRRVGNRIYRMFPLQFRWDVGEMSEGSTRYTLIEGYSAPGEEDWWVEAVEAADKYAESLSPPSE